MILALIAADKAGAFSLAGKKDDAFLAQMEKASAHNAKKGKSKAKHNAPLPKFRTPQLAAPHRGFQLRSIVLPLRDRSALA